MRCSGTMCSVPRKGWCTTSANTAEQVGELVDALYRAESRRVFATLIRLLGDFDRAEEALHDAFAAAVAQWPREGVPAKPRAWLVLGGRLPGHEHGRGAG